MTKAWQTGLCWPADMDLCAWLRGGERGAAGRNGRGMQGLAHVVVGNKWDSFVLWKSMGQIVWWFVRINHTLVLLSSSAAVGRPGGGATQNQQCCWRSGVNRGSLSECPCVWKIQIKSKIWSYATCFWKTFKRVTSYRTKKLGQCLFNKSNIPQNRKLLQTGGCWFSASPWSSSHPTCER